MLTRATTSVAAAAILGAACLLSLIGIPTTVAAQHPVDQRIAGARSFRDSSR